MKKIISFRFASRFNVIAFALMTVFHLVIIIGITGFDFVPLDFLWGGKMESATQLLVFEITSLIIFITGIFANFFVIEDLVIPGDGAASLENTRTSDGLYRTGIFSFILMVIFFDIHLVFLGYLIRKSNYIPGILGILLVIAGVA